MKKLLFFLIVIMISGFVSAQTVQICGDDGEWVPYAYFERVDSKKTDRPIGFTVALLNEIFRVMKIQHTYKLIPWKRCQREVDKFGTRKKYEIITDASFNAERGKKYYFSDPIYAVTPGVFYSIKKFPNTVPIKKPTDLNRYLLCGVRNYNFQMFYDVGINKLNEDLGSTQNLYVLNMVSRGRCDFFLSLIEPVIGIKAIDKNFPEDIDYFFIKEAKKTEFYLLVSKTSIRGEFLIKKINSTLNILKKNGVYDQIYKKYIQ
jgi:polar amino acid transport system substrate-binding protein